MTCATLGPKGRPHLMPLWYVRENDVLRGWTFAKSQKARNLERGPHATLQVEAGVEYHELRGVMLECECVLHRDLDVVWGVGTEVAERYAGVALDEGAREALRAQAAKRVALQFVERRRASWDHRKLGGVY